MFGMLFCVQKIHKNTLIKNNQKHHFTKTIRSNSLLSLYYLIF